MATNTHTEQQRLLTIPETAARLNLSVSHVRRLIHAGEIPALRTSSRPGSGFRIDPAELERWLHGPEDAGEPRGRRPPRRPHDPAVRGA